MALYDSMVGTFAVWSLYLLIVFVRSLRLDAALISGLVIGGGMLTKTNAFFSLYSIPFLILIFNRSRKTLKARLIKFLLLSLVIFVLSNIMYSILRLSPLYHTISVKNTLFVYPFSEWIKHPFKYFFGNFSALSNWFFIYFSIPAIFIPVAFFIKRSYFFEKSLLLLWFLFPFAGLAFFGNTIYPRFILFMTLPLIPLVSYSIVTLFDKFKNPAARAAIILVAFAFYLYADFFLLFNFAVSPIPKADLGQFANDWTAGNGVKQSVEFFREQARSQKINIVTEGTFGLMPYGLEMYLVDNPNIKINAIWPIPQTPPKEVEASIKNMPTYAVFYQPCPPCASAGKIPSLWHSEQVATYRQGVGNAYYSIYKLLP
jgi:hypothetical protein